MSGIPERKAAVSAAGAELARAAACRRRCAVRRRAHLYRRHRHLAPLIRLPRNVRCLPEPALTRAVIARLKAELRRSLTLRARRHWRYSPGRHTALLAALGGELGRLRRYRKRENA